MEKGSTSRTQPMADWIGIRAKPHSGLEWRIFHTLTREDIDDFTDIKFISQIVHKFLGVSSKNLWVFLESLPQPSKILCHLRKVSENVGSRSCDFRISFGESSKNDRKSSESRQKRHHQYVYIIKRTLAWKYEFYVFVAKTISHSFAAPSREILFLPFEHKIHIFSPPCNIIHFRWNVQFDVPTIYFIWSEYHPACYGDRKQRSVNPLLHSHSYVSYTHLLTFLHFFDTSNLNSLLVLSF